MSCTFRAQQWWTAERRLQMGGWVEWCERDTGPRALDGQTGDWPIVSTVGWQPQHGTAQAVGH
eukprot:1195500-Prorocentrum_minimum.AAC.5